VAAPHVSSSMRPVRSGVIPEHWPRRGLQCSGVIPEHWPSREGYLLTSPIGSLWNSTERERRVSPPLDPVGEQEQTSADGNAADANRELLPGVQSAGAGQLHAGATCARRRAVRQRSRPLMHRVVDEYKAIESDKTRGHEDERELGDAFNDRSVSSSLHWLPSGVIPEHWPRRARAAVGRLQARSR
jgi:hypothetical protein